MKSLVLCGFMGCGKSTVGKLLAERLKIDFTDLDEFIEARAGMRISEIFARFSEPGFRDMEHEALAEALAADGSAKVVAAGGGAMISPRNAALAREKGIVIFLRAGFETCYGRIRASGRPLVSSNTREGLENLFLEREPFYRAACGIEIDADSGDTANICRSIENRLEEIGWM